ncbi:helix-turn-helix domain-containing protein [Altererythrobacter sp. KTW20L]|uniref:helix-turn-helix transcriptional regulator n=1 Tax=Altererythrobacter sp. KTW20L TaxID=2942210 RepID=UPI0020BEEE5E|nr:helix-turn-helix domain-containing protein [Altererythrobacter sp. KTW20L]MCL6249436.1 helix-turn-helix domain-containing protein [Altererythrobacter sp. KTW20L]
MDAAEHVLFARDQIDINAVFDSLARIDGKPRLIVNRRGAISAASSGAGEIVALHPSLAIERNCLCPCDPLAEMALEELLNVPCVATRTAVLGEPGSEHHLLLRASSIGEFGVCLILVTAASCEMRNVPEIRVIFGLTDSEAQIVRDMFFGYPPQVIAERRDCSIHTVRAHIRQCYQKLRVHTREQLVAKLLIYYV